MTLFALALPIFFVTANVRHIANSDWVYGYNWWRNGIPERSGFETSELDRAASQIIDYFNNDAELLDVRINFRGADVSLYSHREVLHMVDVKELMAGTFAVSLWTGVFLLVVGVGGAVLLGHRFWGLLYRGGQLVGPGFACPYRHPLCCRADRLQLRIHEVSLPQFRQRPLDAQSPDRQPDNYVSAAILLRGDTPHRRDDRHRIRRTRRRRKTPKQSIRRERLDEFPFYTYGREGQQNSN